MADISGIKINRQAAREIMKMPAVRADLVARGQRIARNAEAMSESGNARYDVVAKNLEVSAHVFVQTADAASIASNAKHNSLVKSVDAGKG